MVTYQNIAPIARVSGHTVGPRVPSVADLVAIFDQIDDAKDLLALEAGEHVPGTEDEG